MNKLARSPGRWGRWQRRRATTAASVGALVVALAATGSVYVAPAAMSLPGPAASPGGAPAAFPKIVVLSNRADLVSGGDALVEVKLPKVTDADDVRVTLNGDDVTDQFAVRPNGRYLGLASGLVDGDNELVVKVDKEASKLAATLTLTNHSKQGPIISGPQVEPYICETDLFGLGPSTPPTCEAPTRYEFFYKPVGSSETDPFEVYDPDSPPADAEIATTTTDEGKRVPFIVRRERGVINRGVYDIAMLHQPGEELQPWGPRGAWNGKLLMMFSGGTKNWHRQALDGTGSTVDPATRAPAARGILNVLSPNGGDIPLARGFAVATSTISQVNNPITSTETAMMVKEHLIETYGPVRYTMAIGCSGGSMMQHLTANNYPGLIDGLIPMCPLPDMWTAVMGHAAFDFPLLGRYFSQTSPQLWPDRSDRIAVYGGADADSNPIASSGVVFSRWFDPTNHCTAFDEASEPEWVYDPVDNPGGVRCALQDFQAQILGLRPPSAWGPIESHLDRGFANSPVDNVGVQYGLAALQRGEISPEQFVDLNVKFGGADMDGNWMPQRKEATRQGLANLYRSGQVNEGSLLDRVPMIHVSALDPLDLFHPLIATEMVRERLVAANGHAENLVQLITVDGQGGGSNPIWSAQSYPMKRAAFLTLDKWLAAMESDRSNAPLEVKVLRHKPVEAEDTCWANGQPGAECPEVFRYPKMVAGAPVASDIMKCQLKPIDWSEYGSVEFTDTQKQQLQQAFPDGVCDWSKRGAEQQPPAGRWLTFADTVGGEPLGPEPRSVPLPPQPKVSR